MLVRLLQAFDNFEIAQDAQLEDGIPPASWAKELGSRKSKEKVRIKNHLTMYVPVRKIFFISSPHILVS